MNTETQCRLVLSKLRNKEIVTQKAANDWFYPVGRLAARIQDLRDAGHHISTQLVKNTHNNGRHGVYRLIKEAKNEQHG